MEAMPIVSPFVPLPRRAKRCRQYNHRSRPKVDVRTSRNFSPAIISESYKAITKSKGLLSTEWLAGYAIWPQTPWQQYCNSKVLSSKFGARCCNLAEKDWL